MRTTFRSLAATALSLSPPAVNAFWRLECDGSVGIARIDPLMDFGGTSDHIHTIKGGSGKFTIMRAPLHVFLYMQSVIITLLKCRLRTANRLTRR